MKISAVLMAVVVLAILGLQALYQYYKPGQTVEQIKDNIYLGVNEFLKYSRGEKMSKHHYLVSVIHCPDDQRSPIPFFHNSGTPIDLYGDGRQAIFVGGVKGKDDALVLYSKKHKRMINLITDSGLNSRDQTTYGAVAMDLDQDGYIDLLVTRSDGITLYKNNKGNGSFTGKHIMKPHPGYSPIAIAISDFSKDHNPNLYISHMALLDKAHLSDNKSSTVGFIDVHQTSDLKGDHMLLSNDGQQFKRVRMTKPVEQHITVFTQTPNVNKNSYQEAAWINLNGPVQIFQKNLDQPYLKIKLPDNVNFKDAIVTIQLSSSSTLVKKYTGDDYLTFDLGQDNKIDQLTVRTIYGDQYRYLYPKVNTTVLMRL